MVWERINSGFTPKPYLTHHPPIIRFLFDQKGEMDIKTPGSWLVALIIN